MKNYKNLKCWQATSQITLRKGVVLQQQIDQAGWLLLYVKWDNNTSTWEKVTSLSFDFTKFH